MFFSVLAFCPRQLNNMGQGAGLASTMTATNVNLEFEM